MVPFAGYEMPVTYKNGLIAEHNAVRTRCGLFDVSHMGEFMVRGPDAVAFVNRVTTNDVTNLAVGQAHYTAILNERGTFEDDCLVYRFANHVMMVVNASNAEKDFAHISQELEPFDATLDDASREIALLAVQGPQTERILSPLVSCPSPLGSLQYYHFTEGTVAGIDATISRTGYTGEDGFELYFSVEHADAVWEALMATGEIAPIGLGARDTLRLEMGMALYGNDIDDTVNPYEAGLGWIVKLGKGEFVGKEALEAFRARGTGHRKLVGFTVAERGAIPRHGYPAFAGGESIGPVCSGTMSPSLGVAIGTCYAPASHAAEGSSIEIEIRGKRVSATVTKFPFYKHASHK